MDTIKQTIEEYIKQYGTTGVPFKKVYKELGISHQQLSTELYGIDSICEDDDGKLFLISAFDELHG